MRKALSAFALLMLTAMLLVMPVSFAYADTALNTELVTNGGAESSAITGWTDNTGASRWNSSEIYSDWAVPAAGSKYFFLFNPSMDTPLTGTMSQDISLSGTEGSGLFASIAAGNTSMHFTISMYQAISADNEVKAIIEELSASGTVLETSQVVNTTAATRAFGSYQFNTQLNPSTRKFRVTLSATLTKGGYAQYDQVSLKLVDASTASAPVYGADFPASGTTFAGTAYTHDFTITDVDAGDIDRLTFSAASTNINLVPAANVVVTGSGTSRTLTITPAGNLSGESDITLTASDGVKSADATLHIVVSKVINMGTNLVENGNATSGYASWQGSTVNITATGNGFNMVSPGIGMYQNIDISKFSTLIDGGETEFTLSASFPSGSGKVTAQFYSNIACTTPVGSAFEVNSGTSSIQRKIPSSSMGVTIAYLNTRGDYNSVTIRNISFQILNNFPKIAAIAAQTTRQAALTVPVHMYYTTASATLTTTSSDQSIVPNGGIAVAGTDFDRSVTFTPLKDGSATITVTANDGTSTATQSFVVTVHEPARITAVDAPAAGYYARETNLDFTVHFSRAIEGGASSVLPLTVGGYTADAAYLSCTADTITYRYTLASDDEGTVAIGSAIDDGGTPITDADDYAAELDITAGATGISVLPAPSLTSTATGGSATYGTRVTFTATLTCADTLSGTVQFKCNGTNIGSAVALSANSASYQTDPITLDAGAASVTADFIPSGTNCRFTSYASNACALTITPKSLSVSGLTATAKTYDGTTDITLSGGELTGVLTGDTVSATYPTAGTAAQKHVGTRAVTYAAITLTGADRDNYTLSEQPSVNVAISPKPLTITATAASRAYDGTTTASVSGVTFGGLVTGDTLASGVDYTATGVFASADVVDDITVTVTVTLASTTSSNNYTLSSDTVATTASITPKGITITGVGATGRAYDGTTTVALSGGTLSGVETADALNVGFDLHSGTLANADAGAVKAVTTAITLAGSRAGNYTLTQPTGVTVTIAKVPLTLTGAAADNKAYDGTRTATVTDAVVDGLVTGETMAYGTDYSATGLFDSADVGTDINVAVTVTLPSTGTARNYSLPANVINTTASITHNGVTITGVSATNRAYDGTTAVALTGGTLVGVEAGDALLVGFDLHTGTAASADVGDGQAVTTAITLTGTKAGNYTLAQPSGITVDIAKATLTLLNATVTNKAYDATTDATVTGVTFGGLATGESLALGTDYTASGVFASADAATDIAVTVTAALIDTPLTRNYMVSGTGSASGTISPRTITGTVNVDITNGTGDASLIDAGDTLTLNTGDVVVPGTLTVVCQWTRNGTDIPGASATSHTVGDLAADPIGTYFTVKATGTGNYAGTLESATQTVCESPLDGSVSIAGTTGLADVLSLDASLLTPATATYGIRWLRDGTPISGAVGASYTITKPDQGTTLTVEVTAYGYYTGTKTATVSVPPSPYTPDTHIVELADELTVDLTSGPTILSVEQMSILFEINATKPVVINGSGYTITFATGAMCPGETDLNLGVQFNAGTGYAAIRTAMGSKFVLMLAFNHDGPLPGVAQITIFVGKQYAGELMEYLYYDPEICKLECEQTAVVDANGYITVTQDHCSSYGVSRIKPDRVPQTGDTSPLLLLWVLVGISATGLAVMLVLSFWRRKHPQKP